MTTLNLTAITAAVNSTLAMVHSVEPLASLEGGNAAAALNLVDEAGTFVEALIVSASQVSDVNASNDLSFIQSAQKEIQAANDRISKLVDAS